nr:hypothetical protein [Tanacetum cinerariifolium]
VIELTVTLVCVIMEEKIPMPNTPQPLKRKAQRFDNKEEATANLPQYPSNTRSFGGYQSKADKDDNCTSKADDDENLTVSKQRIATTYKPILTQRYKWGKVSSSDAKPLIGEQMWIDISR